MGDPHIKDCVSDAVRCLICLDMFSGQPVVSPQHCDHFYCLACITEWTRTTNSCPVDRQKFTVLYQRSCVGRDIQKIITVEPPDGQGLDVEERSGDERRELGVCEECGRSDRRHLMLLCSACDSGFHVACLSPPLAAVPFEDWFCQECATDDSHITDSFSREESEIAEAEVMDLLSEVIPTSSLRLSTTAQRAVSVHTRRSERVRQQRRTPHTTLSQTVQDVPRYLLKSSWSNTEDTMARNLILNTQKADKKVTYKKRKRRKKDVLDPV